MVSDARVFRISRLRAGRRLLFFPHLVLGAPPWFQHLVTRIEITVSRDSGRDTLPGADLVELPRIPEVQLDRLEQTNLPRRSMIGWRPRPFLDPAHMRAAAI